MSKKKNPVAGNQNNAPMTDPTSGQVLDNTDNKGGHLDQVEKIPGSDTRLEIGPLSEPVEGNSNVQKDLNRTLTVDQENGAGASDKSSDAQDSSTDNQEASSEGEDNSVESDEDSSEDPTAETAQASAAGDSEADQANEGQSSDSTETSESDENSQDDEADEAQPTQEGSASDSKEESDKSGSEVTVSEEVAVDLSEKGLRAMYSRILPKDQVDAWDYNTLMLYHTKRVVPEKTVRGNWPVDIRRQDGLTSWTSEELLDWMDGNIKTPKGVVQADLWDEIYKRFRLPSNWTTDATKHYVATGERPDYTKNGLLIDDANRKDKLIGNWTFLELRSALLKEIETDFTDEQLLEQLRLRLQLSENFSGARLLESLPEMPTEANVDDTLLKSKLDEYKNIMQQSGRNLSETTAAQCQGFLYKAIISVMNREPQQFAEGWNILLDWINENYTKLFTDEKARRGWSRLTLSKSAAATFEDVLTLMIQTRKPGNRAEAAKLYSLDHVLRHVTSEQQRSNVILFYTPQH